MASSVTRYTQAVFLSDAARPTPRQYISQRFGFSWPCKGVLHDRLDEIQAPDCSASFGFNPKTQILPELGLKDRNPLTLSLHRGSLASIPIMWFRASFFARSARRTAARRRRAFRGERSRCAVSRRPASSVAGSRATSRAPRRRTITASCWSTTSSRTLTRFSRRLVYVVSLGITHPSYCTVLLYGHGDPLHPGRPTHGSSRRRDYAVPRLTCRGVIRSVESFEANVGRPVAGQASRLNDGSL